MKATLIKSLSNRKIIVDIKEGQTIAEALGNEININNAVMAINGHKVNPDYILKNGDLLTIREIPEGVTAAIATLVFVGITAGLVGGCFLLQNKWAAEAQERELEKMKKMANNPAIDNRPFIRGANNTTATGNSQPYVIGRHFFTPYLHCPYFYSIDGEDGKDQYIYMYLEGGFNKQILRSISSEDVLIKQFIEESPQQGPFTLDPSVFAEGTGEIVQDGTLFKSIPELNYKHAVKFLNTEIIRDSTHEEQETPYTQFTIDGTAQDVEIVISFLNGLYAYNDDADKVETQVTITPQYSLDGGKTFTDFTFIDNGKQTNVFKKNISDKELRYIARKEFTLQDYKTLYNNKQSAIVIRVRSNGNKDSKIKNDCYVLYSQSKCFDATKSEAPAGTGPAGAGLITCLNIEDRERAYCTSIGLKIKSTKNNENKLKKINIITQGTARIVENGAWTKDKRGTSNLAAWILEVLTSDSHPASKIEDEEIDLESFIDFYNYCELKNLTYNLVITTNKKKKDLLQQMLSVAGGIIYRDIYGKYAIAWDHPQENALQVYNAQNIISIDHQRDFTRKIDGLRIKYINSENDLYKEDTYLLMKDGPDGKPLPLTSESLIRDIQLEGITDYEQVVKYGRRMLAIEALRPKNTTIKIGNEGVLFTPMSKLLIQDDSLKIGLGNGNIKSVSFENGKLKKIIADRQFNFENNKKYGLIVNVYNDKACIPMPIYITGTGHTDTFIVKSDITSQTYPRPEAGNQFSFGELNTDGTFTKITTPFLIQSIARSGNDYTVELVNYNEDIYKEGKIPAYKSNITEPPAEAPALPQLYTGPQGRDGAEGLTIYLERPTILYDATAEGAVKAQRTSSRIVIMQGNIPLPFIIGDINSPAGLSVYAQGTTVIVEALEGTSMADEGVIEVPITYRTVKSSAEYVDDKENKYIDNQENIYGEYVYNTKAREYILYISYAKTKQGIQGIQGIQGEKGKDGADGKNGVDGINGENGERAAKYFGIRKQAEGNPPEAEGPYVIGDHYIVQETARIVKVTALPNTWVTIPPSENEPLYFIHVNEITSLLKNIAKDDPATHFVNAYVELLLADTAFIDKLGTKNITMLKDPNDPEGGQFKSDNYEEGKKGWKLNYDGKAEFQDIKLRGNVEATSGFVQKVQVLQSEYDDARKDYLGLYSADYINGPTEYRGFNIGKADYSENAGIKIFSMQVNALSPFNKNWGYNRVDITKGNLLATTYGTITESTFCQSRNGQYAYDALRNDLYNRWTGQEYFIYISGWVQDPNSSKKISYEGMAQVGFDTEDTYHMVIANKYIIEGSGAQGGRSIYYIDVDGVTFTPSEWQLRLF